MWQSSVWQSSVWDALEDNAPQVNLEDVTVKGATDVSKYVGVDANEVETIYDMDDDNETTGGAALLSAMDKVQVWQSSVWYVLPSRPLASAPRGARIARS